MSWRPPIGRKVFNTVTGRPLPCCFDDCEKDGVQLHTFIPPKQDTKYVFCSDRHMQMFIHGPRAYGNLPSGSRGTII